jgi:hypothetical protein
LARHIKHEVRGVCFDSSVSFLTLCIIFHFIVSPCIFHLQSVNISN